MIFAIKNVRILHDRLCPKNMFPDFLLGGSSSLPPSPTPMEGRGQKYRKKCDVILNAHRDSSKSLSTHRPVSDSPTVFSLARRQISLAFLAERAEREKRVWLVVSRGVQPPFKKYPAGRRLPRVWCGVLWPTYFLLNFIANANSTRMCNKAYLFIVMFIAIFNKISPYFVQYQTLWYFC